MGDTSINTRDEPARTENTKKESDTPSLKESKNSIDCLREAKPAEDISINNVISDDNSSEKMQASQSEKKTPSNPAKIETVFEKLDMQSDRSDSTTDSALVDTEKLPESLSSKSTVNPNQPAKSTEKLPEIRSITKRNTPSLGFDIKERSAAKNKSDIFATSDKESNQSVNNIYSVSGSPSGRINRRRDLTSNIFPNGIMGCKNDTDIEQNPTPRRFLDAHEASADFVGHLDSTPRRRPLSAKNESGRNPLTGVGMEKPTEVRKSARRKDGNPLLGIGYEENPIQNVPSTSRVPPGGFSKGLW